MTSVNTYPKKALHLKPGDVLERRHGRDGPRTYVERSTVQTARLTRHGVEVIWTSGYRNVIPPHTEFTVVCDAARYSRDYAAACKEHSARSWERGAFCSECGWEPPTRSQAIAHAMRCGSMVRYTEPLRATDTHGFTEDA